MYSRTRHQLLHNKNMTIKHYPFKIKYGSLKIFTFLFLSISAGSFLSKNIVTNVKRLIVKEEKDNFFND